jgi:hypothetical protein
VWRERKKKWRKLSRQTKKEKEKKKDNLTIYLSAKSISKKEGLWVGK